MGSASSSSKATKMASVGESPNTKRFKTGKGEIDTRSPGVERLNIGIDLGTANICVGVIHNGDLEIIPNELGKPLTPNVVAFSEDGPLIGDAAQDLLAIDSSHTIFDLKRLMGRPAGIVSEKNWRFPFTVTDMPGKNKACIQIDDKTYCPEDICSIALSNIKARVADHLDQTVTGAVITVPGCFKHSQRQATMSAAKLAGFKEVRLVDDNIAAAIMYGQKVKITQSRSTTILIFSVGSGTVEASVIKISRGQSGNNKFKVKGKSGSSILGGIEFDKTLQKQMKEKIRKHGGARLSDARHTARLRRVSEKVKHVLTTGPVASFEFDQIVDELYERDKIKRAEFEEGNAEYFTKCLEHINIAIEESNTEPEEIDEVILVGGSTRIPKLQSLIQNNPMLKGIKINRSLQRDDTIASGAAFLADSLSDQEIKITNICPYSVMCGEDNIKHFSRNDKIPGTFTYKHRGSSEKGNIFPVNEYHEQTKYMELVYSVKLLKQVKTDIEFNVDVNGICSTSENNNYIQQNDGPGTLPIEEMTQQQHALEVQSVKVEKQEERIKAWNEVEKQLSESEVSKTAEYSKEQETLPDMCHKLQEDKEQHIEEPHNKTEEKDQKIKQPKCSLPKAQASKGKLKQKTSNVQETKASKGKLQEKQLLEKPVYKKIQEIMDFINQSEMFQKTLSKHYTEIHKLLTECKAKMESTKENQKGLSKAWKKLTKCIEEKLLNILNSIQKNKVNCKNMLKGDKNHLTSRKEDLNGKCNTIKSEMKTIKELDSSDIIKFVGIVNEYQEEMSDILKYGRDEINTDKDAYNGKKDVQEDAKKNCDSTVKVNGKKPQTQEIKKSDETSEIKALTIVESKNDTRGQIQRIEELTSSVGIQVPNDQIQETITGQQLTTTPSLDRDKTDISDTVGQEEQCLENEEDWECQTDHDLEKLLEETRGYLNGYLEETGIDYKLKQAYIKVKDNKYTSLEDVQTATKELGESLNDYKEHLETAKSDLDKLVKEVRSYQWESEPAFKVLIDGAEQLLRDDDKIKAVTRKQYLDHTVKFHGAARSMLSEYIKSVSYQDNNECKRKVNETKTWVTNNPGATAEKYLEKKQELQKYLKKKRNQSQKQSIYFDELKEKKNKTTKK